MTKKLFLFAVMVSLFAAVGLATNSFAAGAVVEKVDESFTFTDNVFSNPCDPSGNSDVTASGTVSSKGTIITLPDGSQNGTIRESLTGSGTDSSGNQYTMGGFEVEHEVHSAIEGEVSVLRFKSSTGQSFVLIVLEKDLRNNEIEKEKAICTGN